jgi:radical SAM superfamily enzyme YgiQ (UPF0313 family)
MAGIILINSYPQYARGINETMVTPPLGLAYLAAVLEKNNHQVQIIDANILRIKSEKIASSFVFKPDLIGISVNIVNYREAIECAALLKSSYPNTPIIFGGPYCSALAKSILEKTLAIDAIVIGEGENTLLEIAEAVGKKNMFVNIKGVAYRDQGQIIHNQPRPLIENLDEIPLPAYHLLPHPRVYKTRSRSWPVGYVITSRGCPYQCTFCNRNIFGTFWRPHSVNRVIAEIEYLIGRYGIKQLDILDDNFTFDTDRARRILEVLVQRSFKLHINLQNGVRVDKVDEDLLLKMRKAGVSNIRFGIETANHDIQKRVKKNIDLKRAVSLTKTARSLGMVTYGFFMIGLPGDSSETMKQTIKFAINMNPHFANFSICIPFPGTELFEEIKKKGEFLEDVENGINTGFFGGGVFFRLNSMEPQEITRYFTEAYKKFYLRPAKLIDVLSTIRSIGELRWLCKILKDTIKIRLSM